MAPANADATQSFFQLSCNKACFIKSPGKIVKESTYSHHD